MTTDTIELPALHGRTALGFLASLGVLSLLTRQGHPARLSFPRQEQWACITAPGLNSVEDIVAVLREVVDAMGEDEVIPGVHGWPLSPRGRSSGDLNRVTPAELSALVRQLRHSSGEEAVDWLLRVLNQYHTDQQGRAVLTPYMAPAGRQSIYTFFANPLGYVRENPGYLREALVGWQRVEGCTGEYLDAHALISAAGSTDGKAYTFGVPGATWLATMGLALTRLGSSVVRDGSSYPAATMWHYRGGRAMLWPLWTTPLTVEAVRTLIELPFRVALSDGDGLAVRDLVRMPGIAAEEELPGDPTGDLGGLTRMSGYGIYAFGGARRKPGPKSAGPLKDVTVAFPT